MNDLIYITIEFISKYNNNARLRSITMLWKPIEIKYQWHIRVYILQNRYNFVCIMFRAAVFIVTL